MGKAFEKQAKTIEDQGQKQIKAIEDNKKQPANTNGSDYKNELLISKKREIIKNINEKNLDKIGELAGKANYDDLIYAAESSDKGTDSRVKANAIVFLNDIKTNNITIDKEKALQEDFSKYLNMIRQKKAEKPKKMLSNINIHFNGRNDAIKCVENYCSMILDSKRKATEGKGLKVLIPNQMLQSLPIALAQVKVGNNSEKLLNEIRQFFILFISQKKKLKQI